MGITTDNATNLIAYDNFEQTAGNLEGKTLPYGGTWAEVVKTGENGFKVNATSHVAERAKVSDSAVNAGCYAWAGSTKYGASTVALNSITSTTTVVGPEGLRIGVLARGASSESEKNWLGAFIISSPSAGAYAWHVAVIKRVAGTETQLYREVLVDLGTPGALLAGSMVKLHAGELGDWTVEAKAVSGYGTVSKVASGRDSALAVGGALAEGKIGTYDAWTSASANTRTVDGFEAQGADPPGRVCYSGKQVEFNSQGCLRQDSTGTYDGQPDSYRGGNLYLLPEGESGRINRITVRARRNDVAVEEDVGITDKHTTEILVTERFILPR